MSCLSYPIPFISISPAPEEEPIAEPFSPFSAMRIPPSDQNAFRPSHLTPPTTITSFKRSFSHFHPAAVPGQGLESQKFQVLLAASKQRKALGRSGSNQSVNFRKEIAMKAHKNGHSDRRALFLSKLQAPSSKAITAPKTPPESPEIIYLSLPSSALESPLNLFESWSGNHADDVPSTWEERADFRLDDEQSKPQPSLSRSSSKPAYGIPSLDQISARFPRPAKLDDIKIACDSLANEDSPRPSVGIGRLRMPLRSQPTPQSDNQPKKSIPSKSLPPPLSLEPRKIAFPRYPSSTPAKLTESSLNLRDQKASNMLFTLRKRSLSSKSNSTTLQEANMDSEEDGFSSKLRWRRSAPADMTPLRVRFGFEHPILASPGGF
jgi:hypothetical protein